PNGNASGYSPIPHYEDVGQAHIFFPWVQRLYEMGIRPSCGAGYFNPSVPRFCPGDQVNRGETAEMIIRGKYPQGFDYPTVPFFPDDVSLAHPQFAYIQKFREQGITNGTSGTTFGPTFSLTRSQAAVLIVRAFFTSP